jgi:hypothetical protein
MPTTHSTLGPEIPTAITEFNTGGASQGELDVPDRSYRGLGATDNALLGPDANGEVTTLHRF